MLVLWEVSRTELQDKRKIIERHHNCCLSLPLDIVPKDAHVVLRRLSRDLRRYAIRDVLRCSHSAIESLHFKETWIVEVNDEGGSITQLV
ncbi:unnamed protein product [Dibothriocephalus latus]|uniref:Uncharacterized protein n=1 Tax=Dibothriocephalus latus TaxID=60516 RepID=A0A3P7PZK8_DIBLA|nr:unnamed protein product [Dibothriocephalus latus]